MTADLTMSEEDLLGAVLDMAAVHGIRTVHFRAAKTERGWRTPVQGDGKGWPDLVLVGPAGVLFRELKSRSGLPTAEQEVWLGALADAGQNADVWRPADLRSGRILAELRAIYKTTGAVGRG